MANDETTTYPGYLNANFFKRCLTYSFQKNDIDIKSVNLSLGTGTGENYASAIYRAIVDYTSGINQTTNQISLIIKSISVEGNREFLDKIDVYGKEVTMYFKVLPYIHENLNGERVAPKCHYATTDPTRTIVLDDLKAKGLLLKDRRIGLTEDYCRVVLEKVAKFHAASIRLIEKEPLNQEQYKYGFFDPNNADDELLQMFFRKNFKRAAEIVMKMPGYEHFAPKLMNVYDNFVEKAQQCSRRDPNCINVLNHGDLWVNNMMFKHDDKHNPIDVVLLDYQMSHVNSLGMDLNYFFITSAQLPVLQRLDEVMKDYYYPAFEKTLKQIQSECIPTLDQVLNEVKSRSLFGLLNLIGELPIFCLKKEDATTSNYADFLDETLASKTRNAGMSTPRFIATMQYGLKYFEKLNLFD